MKIWITITLVTLAHIVNAQTANDDSTGLPGDNFSLQATLELFKRSSSPEEFEKLINQPDNEANNLDLNNDGEVDYVRVQDNVKGDMHRLALSVPVSSSENRNIAVITIEKTGPESATLQITGDRSLYGEEKIVEPIERKTSDTTNAANDPAFESDYHPPVKGPSAPVYSFLHYQPQRIIVNVWFWPSVRFMYSPAYTVWVSPWHWARYPVWYRPWRPAPVRYFYPRHHIYHRQFIVVHPGRRRPAPVIHHQPRRHDRHYPGGSGRRPNRPRR